MTRILVVGDTHIWRWDQAHPRLRELVREADIAVHCGDWVKQEVVDGFVEEAQRAVVVHGNSDPRELRDALPYRAYFDVDGVRFGVTHPAWGREEPPLAALLPDFPEAARGELDVVLYGHIHVPLYRVEGGIHFVNGGQGYPSFRVPGTVAIVETAPGGTFTVRHEEFAPAR